LGDAIAELLQRGGPRQAPAGDGQENVRAVLQYYEELLGGARR
jgi:hypothetical protein